MIAIIRHGDRTPKQKMKMEVRHKKWVTVFYNCNFCFRSLSLHLPVSTSEARELVNSEVIFILLFLFYVTTN